MNPSVEDRLNSVVRAIGGVILPALPESASLAREQAMLAMGHIQIILAQMPATTAFEAEEADDLHRLGSTVVSLAVGGSQTQAAVTELSSALARESADPPKAHTHAVQDAVDAVLIALASDGDPNPTKSVHAAILEQGATRARKDRQWFSAMGFDSDFSAG
jgi:hypothetical protein